jgi:hypothetical protein
LSPHPLKSNRDGKILEQQPKQEVQLEQPQLDDYEAFRKEYGFSPKICEGYKVYRLNLLNSISNGTVEVIQ